MKDPGDDSQKKAAQQAAQPSFRQVPDRWMIVRILRDHQPPTADVNVVTSWIVESNRLRTLDQLPADIDLETEVTPFVAYQDGDAATNAGLLDKQAEMYIGYKASFSSWKEDSTATRVPLTTMNSSNPLFADYAIHNPNVFSTHDNFSYGDGTQFLTSATCDYIVVGWHSSVANPLDPSPPATDPLNKVPASNITADPSLRGRLDAMFCQLPAGADGDSLNAKRLICHHAIYGVVYDSKVRPPTPADDYAKRFTADVDMEPISVGTSPLDSILTFLEAHKDPAEAAIEDPLLGDQGSATASTLRSMTELLYATQDTYDERIKAADLVYSHNFTRSGGSFTWRYDEKKINTNSKNETATAASPPAAPSPADTRTIAKLNNMQRILDVAESKLKLIQWSLFSEFFKYCSDPANKRHKDTHYTPRVQRLSPEAAALQAKIAQLRGDIEALSQKVQVKRFAGDYFSSRSDPTLCLAGIDAGWPAEYLSSNSPVRLQSSLTGPKNAGLAAVTEALLGQIGSMPVAKDLRDAIGRLVREASGGCPAGVPGHEPWSKQQPFKPQFIEWEGVYYHVGDFDQQWDIGTSYTGASESNHEQLRYVNPKLLSATARPQEDSRALSGRILVLPQPAFALKAVVSQVLGSTPDEQLPASLKDDNKDKEKALKDNFVKAAGKLKFVSGQLTGVTDALLTLANGSHVKPNLREVGKLTVPMKAAVNVGADIKLSEDDFRLMDAETAKTPFGTLTDFQTSKYSPFKGIQHGQFGELTPFLTRIASVRSTTDLFPHTSHHKAHHRRQVRPSHLPPASRPDAVHADRPPFVPHPSLPS